MKSILWKAVAPLFLVIFFMRPASATCYLDNINTQLVLNFGTVAVPANLKIGDVITTGTSNRTPPYHGNKDCDLDQTLHWVYPLKLFTRLSSLGKGVYDTNLPGVGIVIKTNTYYAGGQTTSSIQPWPNKDCLGFCKMVPTDGSSYTVQLIKTGDITAGVINGGLAHLIDVTSNKWPATVREFSLLLGPITINNAATCTIDAGDVNKIVQLQTVKSSDFNNVAGAGDVGFTLTADNCQNASLATFTFTGTPDGTNPVLFKNTADATGVGVRIYPASDSSQSIGANGTNNVQTAQVSGGKAVLSLGAQFYKTAAAVSAGQVEAKTTVTISYN